MNRRFKDTAVNYRQANKAVKPMRYNRTIPKGLWLPVSIVAHLTGVSHQTIRHLYLSRQINGLKYPVGPLLIDMDDIKRLAKK